MWKDNFEKLWGDIGWLPEAIAKETVCSYIESLLKQQREICNEIAYQKIPLWCGVCNSELHINLDLTNAPEPGVK